VSNSHFETEWPVLVPAVIADIAKSAARLLIRRVSRHPGTVKAEYDMGRWHDVRNEKAWHRFDDLRSFLEGTDQKPRYAKIGGRVVTIPTREYYRLRIELLQELLNREAGGADELVEIGCGFGYNLFSLSLDSKWRCLEGLDISENAVWAAQAIAEHFACRNMRFGVLDITKADHPGFNCIEGRTVFTFFCIEQVPYSVDRVIQNLLDSKPRRVIHVEPTTEKLSLSKPLDLTNFLYVKSMDYQCRLFTVLGELARARRIRILTDRRLDFAPTIHNDGFLLTWEPM
jgi:hypothetical protein